MGGKSPATDSYVIEATTELTNVTGFRLEILDDSAPGKGPGRAKNNNFVLSEFTVRIEGVGAEDASSSSAAAPAVQVALQNASADHASKDWPVAWAVDANPKTGWAIDPQFDRWHVAVFETKDDLVLPPRAKLIFQLDQKYGTQHTMGGFRLSASGSTRPLKAHRMTESIVNILTAAACRSAGAPRTCQILSRWISPTALALDRKLADHARQA